MYNTPEYAVPVIKYCTTSPHRDRAKRREAAVLLTIAQELIDTGRAMDPEFLPRRAQPMPTPEPVHVAPSASVPTIASSEPTRKPAKRKAVKGKRRK